jgi:hypothetical protein
MPEVSISQAHLQFRKIRRRIAADAAIARRLAVLRDLMRGFKDMRGCSRHTFP